MRWIIALCESNSTRASILHRRDLQIEQLEAADLLAADVAGELPGRAERHVEHQGSQGRGSRAPCHSRTADQALMLASRMLGEIFQAAGGSAATRPCRIFSA